MKIKKESFTIIILGKWNRYILSPEWVAKHIFKEPKLKIEFAMNFGLPARFTSSESEIRMIPSDNSVTFVCLREDDECLVRMEEMVYTLSDTLKFTPVSAFGVNFGFIESADKNSLSQFFDLSDKKLLDDFGCQFTEDSLTRRLVVDDRVLNLTLSRREQEVEFGFNFHYDVSNTSEVKDKIKDSVLRNKSISEELFRKVYGLEYDKEEGA